MPRTLNNDKHVSRVEAASILDKSPGTLAVWASTKKYNLPFFKIGGEARYWLSDITNFLNADLVR
mgnify:CR=1 FL=1